MSTEEEGSIYSSREAYIEAFSRVARSGEAKCCKCDRLAFVYPGETSHMGICIVCMRNDIEERVQKMNVDKFKGVIGPVWKY